MFFHEKDKKNSVDSTIKNTRIKKERKQTFYFQFVSEIESLKKITLLNAIKLPGPSDFPAWDLKEECREIFLRLTVLINDFIKYNLFPSRLKKRLLPQYRKKMTRK